jgi:hypothetical protein
LPAGVTWLNPPPDDTIVPAGTEKFIIFARERVAGGGQWDYIATAWEYIPNRSEQPITCRVRFERSSWSPDLLFWDEPSDCPEFVRFQVNCAEGPHGYTVNLYEIDYRTWDVVTRLQAPQIIGLGVSAERVFLGVGDSSRASTRLWVLNRSTGVIEPPARPFHKLDDFGELWLIKYDDADKHEFAVFSPHANKAVREFTLRGFDHSFENERALSPDAKRLAVYRDIDFPSAGIWNSAPEPIRGEWTLWNLETEQRRSFTVTTFAAQGSGVAIVRAHFDYWFEKDGRFRCTSATSDAAALAALPEEKPPEELLEVVTVDALTGETSREPLTPENIAHGRRYARMPKYVPAYLGLGSQEPIDEHDVAHAFLKHCRVNYKVPTEWLATNVGFSDDGQRFLLKMDKGDEAEDFFFGDLVKQNVRRIEALSEALRDANDMSIRCVTAR